MEARCCLVSPAMRTDRIPIRTAAQNVALTFSSISRTSGAAGNLIVTGGTNGTTNKISDHRSARRIYRSGHLLQRQLLPGMIPAAFVRGINYD